jgi:predicted enzyme related to lactoylglutathione lyase
MKSNPVVWFEIYVQDMPRSKAFYEAVLGATLTQLPSPDPSIEMWAFPMQQDQNAAGAAGALAKMAGVPSGGNSTMVYFGCEDCATEAGRIVKAGGKIMKEKFSIGPYGHIAIGEDPEGNVFGLHSMK